MRLHEDVETAQVIRWYFTPSLAGITLWIFGAVLVLSTVLIPRLYELSGLGIIFSEASAMGEGTFVNRYQLLSDQIDQSRLVASLGVFLFWALIGLIVHFVISGLIKAAKDVEGLKESLGYIHLRKVEVYKSLFIKLCIRTGAVILFLIALSVFKQFALPYALTAVTSAELLSIESVAYVILSMSTLILSFYVFTVLIRWILLRPRLIGFVRIEPESHHI